MINKTNILDEFMKEFSTTGKYLVPLGLLPEESDKKNPFLGVETALVFFWSYKNNLLNKNIKTLVKKVEPKSLTHKKTLKIMSSTIGKELLNDFYNVTGKEFVVDYIAFTNQWEYSFYKDLEKLYPNISSFSEIPESESEYKKVFALLDSRFEQFKNQRDQTEVNQ